MLPELAAPAAFLAAALVTWSVTPVAIRVASATGFLDRPAGYKGHGRPTPYLGGCALMAGVLTAALAFGGGGGRFAVLTGCALLLVAIGTVDDRVSLSPFLRLWAEIGVAVVLFETGYGWDVLHTPALDLLLTTAWVVGLINAVNLMDNMDGAAASVAGVSAVGCAAVAGLAGDPALAIFSLAVAGGCAGFLPRNLAHPSRIFMGDGGSMPLGLLLACVSMSGASQVVSGAAGVAAAAMLAGLVILDTTLVTVSRRRGRRPLLSGGRDHLTHRLHLRLRSARAVATLLGGVQLILCAVAVVLMQAGPVPLLTFGAFAVGFGVWIIQRLDSPPWVHDADASLHGASRRREPAMASGHA